jgi:hypothetical protein
MTDASCGQVLVLTALATLTIATSAAERARVPKAETALPDPYLSLVVCRAETQRNAKLYALRAHGIRLMRSSDRTQARSSLSLEDQLETLGAGLRDNPAAQAQVERAREAVTTLTEVTVQEPVVAQVAGAERLADSAGEACAKAMQLVRAAPPVGQVEVLPALVEMLQLSQRLARRWMAGRLSGQTAELREAVLADAKGFETHLATLQQRAARDPALAEALVAVGNQWMFQRLALERGRADKEALEHTGRVSEALHELLWDEVRRRAVAARP